MRNPQTFSIQLSHLASQCLELLPRLDSITYRLAKLLRHVVARGLAFLAPEADVEVGSVLLPPLAAALWLAAGAVGLRERSEDRPLSQPDHLTQRLPPGLLDAPNRSHRLILYRTRPGTSSEKTTICLL
jgi:hypothetical protein